MNIFGDKTIKFICEKEDWDIIPKPYPASKLIPEWFKSLPPKIDKKGLESSTIKRCMPFLDALSIGWIIPLAADVEIVTNSDASNVQYRSMFKKSMIEPHGMRQITSPKSQNPTVPKPPLKFMNHWAIKVPKDYSVLFVPPINRHEPRFTCFSGFVDCDKYFEYVNFPFVFNQPNYSGLVEAGTPLVQVIPIKRNTLLKDDYGIFTKEDQERLRVTRAKRSVHESYYKDELHEKKKA